MLTFLCEAVDAVKASALYLFTIVFFQDTLAEATALLTELESHDSPIPEVPSGEGQDMDISNSESTELSAQTPPRSTPSTVLQQSQQDGNSSPDNSSIDESDSKTSQRLWQMFHKKAPKPTSNKPSEWSSLIC